MRTTLISIALTVLSLSSPTLQAEEFRLTTNQFQQLADISGDPERPRRHFRIRNVARLDKEDAQDLYRNTIEELRVGYAASGDPTAVGVHSWQRYNDAPYRSATHGQRYVNNYANDLAAAYGRYEAAGILPEGAIIAKDSYAVTDSGEVSAGPLFVMEKMAPGFNYVTGDWRYTMILPDGEVFGRTKGAHAERVEFCIGCHLVREQFDHLYFVPEAYRVTE